MFTVPALIHKSWTLCNVLCVACVVGEGEPGHHQARCTIAVVQPGGGTLSQKIIKVYRGWKDHIKIIRKFVFTILTESYIKVLACRDVLSVSFFWQSDWLIRQFLAVVLASSVLYRLCTLNWSGPCAQYMCTRREGIFLA